MNPPQARRGMYEYVLTKSVMLIFVFTLAAALYVFYLNITELNVEKMIQSEASRIAKTIDEVTLLENIDSQTLIMLGNSPLLSQDGLTYTVRIEGSRVTIYGQHNLNRNITAVSAFGHTTLVFNRNLGTMTEIVCEWDEIRKGATISVGKTHEYYFNPIKNRPYYRMFITISSEDCGGVLHLVGDWPYGSS